MRSTDLPGEWTPRRWTHCWIEITSTSCARQIPRGPSASVRSHLHERIQRANRKQPLAVSAGCTPYRQHELHDLAQQLQEVIPEVDEPFYTF